MSSLINSLKNWRQTPQGVVNASSCKPITATALNTVYPLLIALHAAVRSAQIDGLYAEFSILQPPTIVPSLNRMAAPTLKLL